MKTKGSPKTLKEIQDMTITAGPDHPIYKGGLMTCSVRALKLPDLSLIKAAGPDHSVYKGGVVTFSVRSLKPKGGK